MAFIDTLKGWFKTGDKPTQTQFYAFFNWIRGKDEKVPLADVDELPGILAKKVEISVFNPVKTDVDILKGQVGKGLQSLNEISLLVDAAFELVLPENSMLFALVINGASKVIVGTDTGLDDLGDSAYPFKRTFQVGLPPNDTIWLQSDTAVTVNPIILQM
ncbi:hypothetical protein ABMY20_12595 [Tenacibaculum sp. SSH1-16]|uniref:hypothetical protein n=1 Tax=Tenacibaculum sp. SSH1-16 TaxID=3136667 RepID=UPI0032C47DFA